MMNSVSIQQHKDAFSLRMSAIATASAAIAVAVSAAMLATVPSVEAATIRKPKPVSQARPIIKLETRSSTRPRPLPRPDRVQARPGRNPHADHVPARPGRGHADRTPARPGKAQPRIRDFRDKRPRR